MGFEKLIFFTLGIMSMFLHIFENDKFRHNPSDSQTFRVHKRHHTILVYDVSGVAVG